jgi:AAA family ATP:ADP antiporter
MRFSIRREDRRNLVVGFVGLLAIMTAHSVMETARDTLFLTSLPATHLPRAYLAIALLAILELRIHERVLRHVRDRRKLLSASLVFGSFITLSFWAFLEEMGAWAPFGFYVWTGLLITVVLIEFWLLLDDAVTVTQAKRIFPAIAAGGVTGAMLGSLLAEGVLRVASPAQLVLAATVILALASATPFLWKIPDEAVADQAAAEPVRPLGWLLRDSYLSRVLTLVLMGTVALTVVDFVFKSTVADHIPAEGLGPFFARFYLGLNSVALLIQIVGAGWLLRAFGAHRSSALLPSLIFGGAIGLSLGPVLLFAVALKAVDGSLRHTLYRSAVEVLYLPLDSKRRERAKGIIEVFGHRGGQAVASLLIIAAVGVGLTTQQLGIVLLFLVIAWVVAIMSTQRQYVDLFRRRLRRGVIDTRLELEELDRHSLDVLLSALNSDQDLEVIAAIDIFDRHGKVELIPVLVLYHPSTEVRSRALEAFADARDRRFIPVARRMLSDEDPDIRAAALRALTAVVPSRELLEEKLDVEASIVQPRALIELIASDDDAVRLETLRAMEGSPDPRYLAHLLPLLGNSDLRAAARSAVVAIGPEALVALDEALRDPSTSRKVRRRIPHTIILFDSQDAADILLEHLDREREGGVRLKIVRALGRLQATQPSIVLDDALLRGQLRGSLLRVIQLLQWRAALESNGTPDTADAELLRVALQDKERAALERAFGLMGLRHPEENFNLVWRGVTSDNAGLQAAGREVLEATLPGSFREAVLAIIDNGESPARRARIAAAALGATVKPLSHEEAVREMMQDQSEVIRGIAAHHTAELGLGTMLDTAQETQNLV